MYFFSKDQHHILNAILKEDLILSLNNLEISDTGTGKIQENTALQYQHT
jgi:hypothetical protein